MMCDVANFATDLTLRFCTYVRLFYTLRHVPVLSTFHVSIRVPLRHDEEQPSLFYFNHHQSSSIVINRHKNEWRGEKRKKKKIIIIIIILLLLSITVRY